MENNLTEENTNVCLKKDGVWATVVSDEKPRQNQRTPNEIR